jgi:hypothetical protein
MIVDAPTARTLRELLLEIQGGFTLHRPLLVEVGEAEWSTTIETTVEQTTTRAASGEWAVQVGRELASHRFLLVGANVLSAGLDTPLTVGRSRRCDVRIDNESVSKVHGSLSFERATGRYLLVDEGSRNGTRVNGEPLVAGVPAPVWAGANVAFGDALYVFLDPQTVRKLARLAVT